jgi:hypothetical protein
MWKLRKTFAEAGKRIKFAGFGNSAFRSREMGECLRTRFYNGVVNISEVKTPRNKTYFLLNLPLLFGVADK